MSNHFTGLSLGPPLGDQRLDLCDLYAFQSPIDPTRTVLILNANPQADALHPDAIYRLAIDADGLLPDMLTFAPAKPARYPNGRVFTDDVIDHRLAFLSKGGIPPTGLKPHSDILGEFPYIGNPHPKTS
jgi:hypothetical protein